MAGQLQESHAGLEQKVEERTHELQTRSRELAQQAMFRSVRGTASSAPF
jgi:nitrate/nitrite-specific signal transduction histidine kinase